jgi:hypothetical protein
VREEVLEFCGDRPIQDDFSLVVARLVEPVEDA